MFAGLLRQEHLSASGRRRVASLTSRDALQAHGRALDICLAQSYTAHYVAECAEGKAFLLSICDTRTGAPRSTAELGLHRDWAIRGYGVELRQFTGRGNALPSPACRTTLDEVLASVPTPAMQEHLARTAMALAERRRLSKDAAARRARLLPLDRALARHSGRAAGRSTDGRGAAIRHPASTSSGRAERLRRRAGGRAREAGTRSPAVP